MDDVRDKRMTFEFINLFRALAAFWVLCAHVQIWGGWQFFRIPDPKIAVDLFMMISGFLMADTAIGRWHREPLNEPRARAAFWARRFFRIAPAYYVAMLVVLIGSTILAQGSAELQRLNGWTPGNPYDPVHWSFGIDNVLMHVTFLFGLVPKYVNAMPLPDWSLSLEMQFYLAFPAIFLCVRRFGPLIGGVALAVVVLILGQKYAMLTYFNEPSLLLFKLQYFIAGMLLFSALDRSLSLANRTAYVAAGAILTVMSGGYGLHRYDIAWLFMTMFALGLMECREQLPSRIAALLRCRAVRFASTVSYSVYLFHGCFIGLCGYALAQVPDLAAMPRQERTAWIFLVTLVGAYTTAAAVHRLVELPGISVGRRVTRWISDSRIDRVVAGS